MSYDRMNPTLDELIERLWDYAKKDYGANAYPLSGREAFLLVEHVSSYEQIQQLNQERDEYKRKYLELASAYIPQQDPSLVRSILSHHEETERNDLYRRMEKIADSRFHEIEKLRNAINNFLKWENNADDHTEFQLLEQLEILAEAANGPSNQDDVQGEK